MKSLALVLVFFASLGASASLLTRILPAANVPQYSEKLAYFAARKDEYDTLFIGSSRTFRQLLPSLFDPAMAAAGQPTRSFNFGLDGMFSPEDAYVAERILALRPARLRRVFLEISGFNTDFTAQPEETRRALHWHDVYRTKLICQDILPAGNLQKLINLARWQKAWKHLRLCLVRGLNLGEATRFADGWRGVPPSAPQWVIGEHGDGAVPYNEETPFPGENREAFDRDMKTLAAGKASVRPLPPAPLQSLSGTIKRMRALGIEPVLFIAPMAVTRINTPAGQVSAPILDFSDPNRWPTLFDPAHRYDRAHLNAPGSRVFTRLFAEEVLALPRGDH